MNSLFLALAFAAVAAFFGLFGFCLGVRGANRKFAKELSVINLGLAQGLSSRQAGHPQARREA